MAFGHRNQSKMKSWAELKRKRTMSDKGRRTEESKNADRKWRRKKNVWICLKWNTLFIIYGESQQPLSHSLNRLRQDQVVSDCVISKRKRRKNVKSCKVIIEKINSYRMYNNNNNNIHKNNNNHNSLYTTNRFKNTVQWPLVLSLQSSYAVVLSVRPFRNRINFHLFCYFKQQQQQTMARKIEFNYFFFLSFIRYPMFRRNT